MTRLEASPQDRWLRACSAGATLAAGSAALVAASGFACVLLEAARRAEPALASEAIGLGSTARIAALTCAFAAPVGVGAGLFLAEFGAGRLGRAVRTAADIVGGVPAIVVGASALVLTRDTALSATSRGALALAAMMVPRVARVTDEALRRVPASLREAALGLGVPRWRTTFFVVVRTAAPDLLRGVAQATARVLGEAVPLLVLGVAGADAPLSSQAAELALGRSPAAWGPAAILLAIVMALALVGRTGSAARREAR